MIDYTQNAEASIFVPYLQKLYDIHGTGKLLSIGENDGKCLSNALNLIELGWDAVLVEPAPIPFAKLKDLHKNNPKVHCFPVALGIESGKQIMWDSDEHLSCGDTSLLSTLVCDEKERWGDTQKFNKIFVDVLTYNDFILFNSPFQRFDFISIDAEGLDFQIISQINLIQTKTSMVIIEWNSKDFQKFDNYFKQLSFKLLHKNHENLIYISTREKYNYE